MFDEVNPAQAILVTSRSEVHIMGKDMLKDNVMTLTWYTPLSFNPKMFGILVGKERLSHGMISRSKSFCVNFMPIEAEKAVMLCGSITGRTADKFEKAALIKEECGSIDCPRIKGSLGHLECEVVDEKDIGDHTLFIGKVLKGNFTPGKRIFYKGLGAFTTTI